MAQRKQQQQQQAPVVPIPPPPPVAENIDGFVFLPTVKLEAVPTSYFGAGTHPRRYQVVEDRLRALPAGEALPIKVPDGSSHKTFAPTMLSAIRKVIPGCRSRSTKDVVYLWIGEKAAPRAPKTNGAGGKA